MIDSTPRRTTLPLLLLGAALLGCAEPASGGAGHRAFEVEVVRSEEIPTVLAVTFRHPLEGIDEAYVEIGRDRRYSLDLVPAEATDDGYRATIMGLKPLTDYHLRAGLLDGDASYVSGDHVVSTGAAPQAVPSLELSTGDAGTSPGGYFITSCPVTPSWMLVYDADGDPVWWTSPPVEGVITRSALSLDRTRFLGTVYAPGDDRASYMEQAALFAVSVDGSTFEEIPIDGPHHDFVEREDGTIAAIAYDVVEDGATTLVDDSIVELDPDGDQRTVWLHGAAVEGAVTRSDQQAITLLGHANALDYLPQTDAYVLSMRNENTLYAVDARTGETLWVLGDLGDIHLADGDGSLFTNQHQFQVLDDGGIVVFDNGDLVNDCSRAVEYRWDPDTGIAENVWEYALDPCVRASTLGDVTRFDDGKTMITWSTQGEIDLVDDTGELLWSLNAGLGGALGYVQWTDSLNARP